jgi:hypothetical protein
MNPAREATQINIASTFTDNLISLMSGIHEYERRATEHLRSLSQIADRFYHPPSPLTYSFLKSSRNDLEMYMNSERNQALKERLGVVTLLGHIQRKLVTYGLKRYDPASGLQVAVSCFPLCCYSN